MSYKKWGDARHLTRALFDQDKVWVTANSEVMRVTEMDPAHCLNTLLMLERLDDLSVPGLQDTPLYAALKARVVESFSRPAVECSGSVIDKLRLAQRTSSDVLLDYAPCNPGLSRRRCVRFSDVRCSGDGIWAHERRGSDRFPRNTMFLYWEQITSCEIIPNSGGNP